MNRHGRILALTCLACLVVLAPVVRAEVLYDVIDLGAAGGWWAINNQGQVTTAFRDTGQPRAGIWEDGVLTLFDVLPGDTYGMGMDINDLGQVAGHSSIRGVRYRPCFWDGIDPQPVQLGPTGFAYGINNLGHMLVHAFPTQRAYVLIDGQEIDILDQDGLPASGWRINDQDQVAAQLVVDGSVHAGVWDPVGGMQDLGELGGGSSHAEDINDSGIVAGWSSHPDGDDHTVIWDTTTDPPQMRDLGILGNSPTEERLLAINNLGQAVGDAWFADENGDWWWLGIVWDEANGLRDLNDLIDPDSGWLLSWTAAINDMGWIAGEGTNPDGEWHGFLLIPAAPPTPEERVEELGDLVIGLVDVGGIAPQMEDGLLARLDVILDTVEREQLETAINKLNALANHVDAQTGKKIDVTSADEILAAIDGLIDSLAE